VKAAVLVLLQGALVPIDADAFVEFASIPAPVGREARLLEAIRARLPDWAEARVDAAGNLHVEVGPGERPGELVLAPLGDPALRVASIDPGGYLRVKHAERRGAFLRLAWVEGRPVTVVGEKAEIEGVALVNSIHLRGRRPETVGEDRIWIDVGAASADDARERGIREGDRIAPDPRVSRLAGDACAGWFVGRRACAFGLLEALRGLDPSRLAQRRALVWTVEGGERAIDHRRFTRMATVDAAASSDPVVRAPAQSEHAAGQITLRALRLGGPTETVALADLAVLAGVVREFLETGEW